MTIIFTPEVKKETLAVLVTFASLQRWIYSSEQTLNTETWQRYVLIKIRLSKSARNFILKQKSLLLD